MLVHVDVIKNWNCFETLINECEGEILMGTESGTTVKLTEDNAVSHMQRELNKQRQGVDLHLTEPRDFVSFMQFLMDCGRPVKKRTS